MAVRGPIHGCGGSNGSDFIVVIEVRHPVQYGGVSDASNFMVNVVFDSSSSFNAGLQYIDSNGNLDVAPYIVLNLIRTEQSRESVKHRNIKRRNTDEGGKKEKLTREIHLRGKGGTNFLGSPLESLDVESLVVLSSTAEDGEIEVRISVGIPDSDVQRIADKIDKLNTSETKCDFSNHLGTESEDSKEDWSDGEIYDFNFKSVSKTWHPIEPIDLGVRLSPKAALALILNKLFTIRRENARDMSYIDHCTYVYDTIAIDHDDDEEDDLRDLAHARNKEHTLGGSYNDSNCNVNNSKLTNYQPPEKLFKRYSNKINVEKYEGPSLPGHAANFLIESGKKLDADRFRTKDKHDRATAEQVMDPRTRMILFKLLNRGTIASINGCISTGKEANVYHATSKSGEDRAIKIYKTSILIFKDRDKYVSGEFRQFLKTCYFPYRFRRGYCRHNPRKMVRTWAEKEMRNLVRMFTAGMSVPEPILLRSHVLLMDFIGKDGWPAPKYHNSQIYIIDVSQSVEHDHPHALDFLRKDCTNITDFFKRKEVATMTIKELFDFITDPTIREINIEEYLDKVSERAAARTIEVTSEEYTAQEQIDEEVFKNAFIPKRLAEVVDIERDIRNVKSGKEKELVYKTITGLKGDLSGPQTRPEILEKTTSSGEEEEDSSERENSSEDDSKFVNSSRPRDESPDSKKKRKKAVKEQQAEKRKEKVKKHIKKRKERLLKKK
uniref:Serine/threonine-protein kinase RIO1 n=1 Tax=Timema californicum TaxID=61474 RepID=A0A7R9JAW6_TIMCA|nr:unnamed protein product [Timema californicum]